MTEHVDVLIVGAGISGIGLLVAIAGPWAMGWHMLWQMRSVDLDDPDKLVEIFRSNKNAGLLPVLFFAIALLV